MGLDKKIKKLIERISFLSYDEKGNLISRLPSLDTEKKERLFDFLAIEEAKIVSLNLRYLVTFEKTYHKWQNTFSQISQLIK